MTSKDPSDRQGDEEQQTSASAPFPKIRPISAPMDVPVFNVVIYISQRDGKTQARVANLPDLCFTAASEPLALKEAITTVKQKLADWYGKQEVIPWLDPQLPLETGEQERLVPVHL